MSATSRSTSFSNLIFFAGWLSVVVGLTVLVGWVADNPYIKGIHPSLASMKANTALCILLLGCSLLFSNQLDIMKKNNRIMSAGFWITTLTALSISVLTLMEYLWELDFGIDQILFADFQSRIFPGRMSPITAIIFSMLSFALILNTRSRTSVFCSHLLALISSVLSLIALLGYALDISTLYQVGPYTSIALHTSIVLFVLGLAVICLRPNNEFFRVFGTNHSGSILARKLLPVMILTFIGAAWLSHRGFVWGFYSIQFSSIIIVASCILIFSAMIWINAKKLNQADAALKRSHQELEQKVQDRTQALELYETIVSNMAEGVCLVRADDGTIPYANPKFEQMFGYESGELVGKHVSIVNYQSDTLDARKVAIQIMRSILEDGSYSYEVQNVRKDGSPFWCMATSSTFKHHKFGLVFVSVHQDITEHKREESIRKSTEIRYRNLFEGAHDSILVVNAEGKIQIVNKQVEKSFGYPAAELIGEPVELLIPKRHRQRHEMSRENYTKDPSPRPMGMGGLELYGLRKNGTEFPVEISLSPLVTPGGSSVTAIIRDISDRKLSDNKIKASLKEKETLLKEIHHRVKNNLNIISSLLDLQAGALEGKSLTPQVFKDSQGRIRSIALIHEKLYQLKDFSQVRFKEYVEELAEAVCDSYGVDRERFSIDIDIGEFPIEINSAIPCGLILNELFSNSFKYAFKGRDKGKIEIRMSHSNEHHFTLVFADDGVGFSKDFDFRRSKSLGLQLVMTLVEQLSGTIHHEGTFGSAFSIEFDETLASQPPLERTG